MGKRKIADATPPPPKKKKPRIEEEEDVVMEKPHFLRRKTSFAKITEEKQVISVLEVPTESTSDEFSVSKAVPAYRRSYKPWSIFSFPRYDSTAELSEEDNEPEDIFFHLKGIRAKYYEYQRTWNMTGNQTNVNLKETVEADLNYSVMHVGFENGVCQKFKPLVSKNLKYGGEHDWRLRHELEAITENCDDWLSGKVYVKTDRDLVYDILVDFLEVDKGLAKVMVSFLPNDRSTSYQNIKLKPFAKYLLENKPLVHPQIVLKSKNPKSFNSNFDMRYARTFKQAVLPDMVATIKSQIQGQLINGLNLFSYQEQAVAWMLQIERQVKRNDCFLIDSDALQHLFPGFYLSINEEYSGKKTALPKDLPKTKQELLASDQIFTYESCPLVMSTKSQSYKFGFSGGILADETGVGKTCEALSLIVAQPGESRMKFDIEMKLFHTGATLVICPNQLVAQWVGEARKFFDENKLKIVYFTVQSEYSRLSAKDVLEADIVLVSSSFLKKNQGQFMNKYEAEKYAEHSEVAAAPMGLRRSRRKRTKSKYPPPPQADSQKVFLAGFFWHRIMLDEGHECLELFGDNMELLKSTYRWYLSASPFPSFKIISSCAHYLNIHSDEIFFDWEHLLPKGDAPGTVFGKALDNIFSSHLLYRTTKNTIDSSENFIPDVEEQVIWVDFHPYERAMYNTALAAGNRTKAFRYCSMVHDPRYVSDNKTLLDIYKIQVQQLKQRIEGLKNSLQWAQQQCAQSKPNHDQYEAGWQAYIMNEGTKEQKEKHLESGWEAFKYEFRALQIKFNRTISYNVVWDWDGYRSYSKKIPQHQKDIKEFERQLGVLNGIKFDVEIQEWKKALKPALAERISRIGTKLARCVEFVQETLDASPENRIIVISQHTNVLKVIQMHLKDAKIMSRALIGNVYIRNKTIRSFLSDKKDNKEEMRVILLSTKKSASGTNLPIATHVLLLDQFNGLGSEIFAAEKQAIGRALRQQSSVDVVKVVRILIEESLEAETYLQTQNALQQG